jgi:DNA-binding beta-propeller fold protein YncE
MRARGEPRVKVVVTAVVLIAVIAVSSMLSNVYAVASDEYVFDFKFGSPGAGDGRFDDPIGVAYDPNNNRIIVADYDNHRIQVFDSNGNFLFKFGREGFGNGEFNAPRGVAYDPNNNRIIVADNWGKYRIQVFDSNGNFLFKFGSKVFDDGGIEKHKFPTGVAYDPNNNRIIVADYDDHRIQVFDSNGNFLFKFGSFGFGDGEFRFPTGVAYDPNNNRIIVTDTLNYRIQVFDSNGNFLFKFGREGFGEFHAPIGVAYDPNNNRIIVTGSKTVFVAGIYRIQVFDSNGNFLFKFGSGGSGDGEFNDPIGVAYDPNNNRIIVADTANHRIQVFSPNYTLTLYEGSNPSDGVINLGEDITAKVRTNNTNIVNVKFTWIDPNDNIANTNTVNIVNGEASDTYTPNQVGTWKVKAEFSDGTVIIKEINISVRVVPELIPMVGVGLVMGSLLAVLALYRKKRGDILLQN